MTPKAKRSTSATGHATLSIHPLTPERWNDLLKLFGPRGACGGCWCMHWRLTRREYEAGKGAAHRDALRSLVESRSLPPGLLAYRDGQAVGWCSIGPRADFSTLARSRILKPVDDLPVWSLVCLFVEKTQRQNGVSRALIDGAAKFAADHGAAILEAYPVEPKKDTMPDVFAFTGIASTFRRAGFQEVARRSETRPVMRKAL